MAASDKAVAKKRNNYHLVVLESFQDIHQLEFKHDFELVIKSFRGVNLKSSANAIRQNIGGPSGIQEFGFQ